MLSVDSSVVEKGGDRRLLSPWPVGTPRVAPGSHDTAPDAPEHFDFEMSFVLMRPTNDATDNLLKVRSRDLDKSEGRLDDLTIG
jgi:hypothetical protein